MKKELQDLLSAFTNAPSVYSVPRNDLAAAVEFYKTNGEVITGDDLAVLLQLQDDPRELEAIVATWNVVTNRE